jgi:hypothetical protein
MRHIRPDSCYAAYACGTKSRRGHQAALPGADVWRHAWGNGVHCSCAARHAAERFNDHTFAESAHFSKFAGD